MVDLSSMLPSMQIAIQHQLGDRIDEFLIPPPVFTQFQGAFIEFDPDTKSLTTRFPILTEYLNPYHNLQGGVIASLVDNTIGPLSVLVAPPNVTRQLELTYKRPVTPLMEFVTITGRLVQQNDPKLIFKAKVYSPEGDTLALAKATHWILPK